MSNLFRLANLFLINFLAGVKLPAFISVDVTNRCNLKCKHCYFFKYQYNTELSEEELLNRIREIKNIYPQIVFASWVGGEPLLRKTIIERGRHLFPFNMIVTNGLIKLPTWKKCVFNVSVDGTEEYYKRIRGLNLYQKVKNNANRDDIKVNVACVLNKENYQNIDDFLKEWSRTKVKGVIFNFYTPLKNQNDNLWIDWHLRDKLINKIIYLKSKYGNFILNSNLSLKLMKSDKANKITNNCLMPQSIISLDPLGKRKWPCVMGELVDCSRCGCIVAFQAEIILKRKKFFYFYNTGKIFT